MGTGQDCIYARLDTCYSTGASHLTSSLSSNGHGHNCELEPTHTVTGRHWRLGCTRLNGGRSAASDSNVLNPRVHSRCYWPPSLLVRAHSSDSDGKDNSGGHGTGPPPKFKLGPECASCCLESGTS
jgi:hypothetical protein